MYYHNINIHKKPLKTNLNLYKNNKSTNNKIKTTIAYSTYSRVTWWFNVTKSLIVETFRGCYKQNINYKFGYSTKYWSTPIRCSFNKLLLKKHKNMCINNKLCTNCEYTYYKLLKNMILNNTNLIKDINNIVNSYLKLNFNNKVTLDFNINK